MLSKLGRRYISSTRFADRISPAVQFYARSYNLSLDKVKATGPYGIILKADVINYARDNNMKEKSPWDADSEKNNTKKEADSHKVTHKPQAAQVSIMGMMAIRHFNNKKNT